MRGCAILKQQSHHLVTSVLRGRVQRRQLLLPFWHVDFGSKVQETPYDDEVIDACSNKQTGTQVAIRGIPVHRFEM
jgi:hypothetical protein